MKKNLAVKKGFILALTLVFLNKILCMFGVAEHIGEGAFQWMSAIAFGIIVFMFLMSKKISHLLITGFLGLASLVVFELICLILGINGLCIAGKGNILELYFVYFWGFLGSMAATALAIVLVLLKVNFDMFDSEKFASAETDSQTRIKLILYALVSAASFTYLVLPSEAALSVFVFAVLQLICLWFVVPDKKRLWLYIPIFVLALNSFISGNSIWRVPNVIVSIFLYGAMFADINIGKMTLDFVLNVIRIISVPFEHFSLPFRWTAGVCGEKKPLVKRVLLALLITIPLVLILITMLSYADMVFARSVKNVFREIFEIFSFNAIWKIICGVIAGLYLFGLVYTAYLPKAKSESGEKRLRHGDFVIINILLASVLIVYTFFVVVQFRYLFAGAALPYGLTYTEYARKGFFELFILTGINILGILLTVHLTRENSGTWHRLTKALCAYLCAVTVVLLISSFYRMYLYSADDGLTRLRFMVFGFLIFEGVGLGATFVYIFRPKFNAVCVYISIGLLYYMLLNAVPMDYFVAKSQVDIYLGGGRESVDYVMTLSTDAAPQVQRLLGSGADAQARAYFANHHEFYTVIPQRWQRYNLSVSSCDRIYCEHISK